MADDDASPVLPSATGKRKATSSTPSPAPGSRKRMILESVTVPRRSKLSTEKTTSADNLTLASSRKGAVKREVIDLCAGASDDVNEEEDQLHEDDEQSDAPLRPTRRTTRGKPNYVTYDLSETESEDEYKASSSKGKGKAKSNGTDGKSNGKANGKASPARKRVVLTSDDSDNLNDDFDPFINGDFAMDSDDEEAQLKAVLKRSKSDAFNSPPRPSTMSTSASPASSTKGKGKGGRVPKVTSAPLGGVPHKSDTPRRSAMARAAERRLNLTNASESTSTRTSPDDSMLGTPLSSVSGSSTPYADRVFSESASPSDGDEFENDDLDTESSALSSESDFDEAPPKKGGKNKGKSKANGEQLLALGYRLDGLDGDAMPDGWIKPDTEELARRQKQILEERERRSKETKLIKAMEDRLKQKLGLGKKGRLPQSDKNRIRLCLHHPELEDVWGDLEANIEPVKPVPMEAHPSLKLTLLPFQKESLYWMKEQEKGPWKGGMLADEMGMGKTIQTIALLLSEPRRKPSLVVAPVVALMQWKNEIETHAEGFSVCLWHGSGRKKAEDLKKFDVVLVSYGTLEASFRRQQNGFKKGNKLVTEKSPMHSFEWYRVVLDEAHNIKERATNAAKASFALQAKYRWCLSGTPLQNRVGELYSLVRFLGADPFSYYFCKACDCKSLHWAFANKRECDDCGHTPMQHVSLWNSEILTPIAKHGIEKTSGPGKTAFKKLKILLDRMMLRRTKLERADDLGLPPRTIVVRRDYFSPEEKELYLSLFTNARRTFNTYIAQGTVLNNYSNIFSLITRMRQMACHPDLVLRSKTSTLALDVSEGTVCRLCNDTAEDAIVSNCKHVFDRECVRQYLEAQQSRGHRPECPVCHIEISIDLEQEAIDLGETPKSARQGILSRLDLNNWRSSSKLEALVEELEKLRRKDSTMKSLVFSQFVSFLDLIAFRLGRAGFNICRLEGGMSPQQRNATIQHFMNNPQVSVFLISLKAGGVALNLTEASTVFMMDSWWNPSVEYQAMDRIHRLGQKRPVRVVKLVVEDSIEDQIVQLQAKKLAMTDAALSRDPEAALGKLTVEDLGFLFKL